jgi:hypothetical protein
MLNKELGLLRELRPTEVNSTPQRQKLAHLTETVLSSRLHVTSTTVSMLIAAPLICVPVSDVVCQRGDGPHEDATTLNIKDSEPIELGSPEDGSLVSLVKAESDSTGMCVYPYKF